MINGIHQSVKTKELSTCCKTLSVAEFGIFLGYFWFSKLVLIFYDLAFQTFGPSISDEGLFSEIRV